MRILAISLLVLFAAGTSAHAAAATKISIAMSSMADEGGMEDCDGCLPTDGDGALQCASVCGTPLAATLTGERMAFPFAVAEMAAIQPRVIDGQTAPPEPRPPRLPW